MTTQKTLWVWHPTPVGGLVQLAERYGLTRLFVWVSPGFTKNRTTTAWLQRLGVAAQARGVALDALCGDPVWAQRPALAGAWAAEVQRWGRFERLHLDVEPHALPQWSANPASLVAGLVAAVETARAAGGGRAVDVDVPTWYHTITMADGRAADVAVLDVADSVTLMAYQDTIDKILTGVGPQMATAEALGRPVFIGINFAEPVNDAPTSSLWGQSHATQRNVISEITSNAATFPACTGIALHEATSLAALGAA